MYSHISFYVSVEAESAGTTSITAGRLINSSLKISALGVVKNLGPSPQGSPEGFQGNLGLWDAAPLGLIKSRFAPWKISKLERESLHPQPSRLKTVPHH